MEMKVELSENDYQKLIDQAKEELRDELTDDAVIKFLEEQKSLPINDYLKLFGVYKSAEYLESWSGDKTIKELTRNDKLTLAIYWLMYEKLA